MLSPKKLHTERRMLYEEKQRIIYTDDFDCIMEVTTINFET